MSREEVFERLNEVFRDVFDEEDITVDEGTTAEDIDGWDSLEHINLMAAVESEHQVFHGTDRNDEKCRRNGRYHSAEGLKPGAGEG